MTITFNPYNLQLVTIFVSCFTDVHICICWGTFIVFPSNPLILFPFVFPWHNLSNEITNFLACTLFRISDLRDAWHTQAGSITLHFLQARERLNFQLYCTLHLKSCKSPGGPFWQMLLLATSLCHLESVLKSESRSECCICLINVFPSAR